MVKLVDMPDLGSGAARRVGSSPIIRTELLNEGLFYFPDAAVLIIGTRTPPSIANALAIFWSDP